MVERLRNAKVFVEECWAEMERVTWPDYDQLKSTTVVIILFVFLVSAIIALMDAVVRVVVDLILGVFGV